MKGILQKITMRIFRETGDASEWAGKIVKCLIPKPENQNQGVSRALYAESGHESFPIDQNM
jgi:hypothetical protein